MRRANGGMARRWSHGATLVAVAAWLLGGCTTGRVILPGRGGDTDIGLAAPEFAEISPVSVLDCGESALEQNYSLASPLWLVRLSVSSSGQQANGPSDYPCVSGDGRCVAFVSWASNLVEGDTNDMADVFVHEIASGQTTRVSIGSEGQEGNGDAGPRSFLSYSSPTTPVCISHDGSVVGFESSADNLVAGDFNGQQDIFVRDRSAGFTAMVSWGVDRTPADSECSNPSISSDGQLIAFESLATNLVRGDTNHASDVFVHDRRTGTTIRASVASDGSEANDHSVHPAISVDGRYVIFESRATNLTADQVLSFSSVFMHDLETGRTWRVASTLDQEGGSWAAVGPTVSADGGFVAFMGLEVPPAGPNQGCPTGNVYHLPFADPLAGQTIPVAFGLRAYNNGQTTLLARVSVSAGGRYVAYRHGRSQIHVADHLTGQDVRVDVPLAGLFRLANFGASGSPSISANGTIVTFTSTLNNLVEGDANEVADIFAVQWIASEPQRTQR